MLPAVRVATDVVVASTVAGAIDSRDGGLAPGDVIYAVNRVPVSGLGDLRALLRKLRIGAMCVSTRRLRVRLGARVIAGMSILLATNIACVARLLLDPQRMRARSVFAETSRLIRKSPPGMWNDP